MSKKNEPVQPDPSEGQASETEEQREQRIARLRASGQLPAEGEQGQQAGPQGNEGDLNR